MKLVINGIERDATPEEEAEIIATQELFNIPIYTPPIPALHCVATLDYLDFDIDGIANGAGMASAFVIDIGKLWIFFENPMISINYSWNVSSSVGKVNVTDRQLDYIEITVTDDAGASVTAASISVQIFKVN